MPTNKVNALPEEVESALMAWRGGCEHDDERLCCPDCAKRLDAELKDSIRRSILEARIEELASVDGRYEIVVRRFELEAELAALKEPR